MASGLLYALAGGLQGLGTGITNQAVAAREAALERLRQQGAMMREQMQQQGQADRDKRLADEQAARDERLHGYKLDESSADYKNKAGLLAIGGDINMRRDAQQHGYKVQEIKTQQIGQQELERIKGSYDLKKIAAQAGVDQKEVIGSPVRGEDGQYYLMTRGGRLLPTGVNAAPYANEMSATGGGALTESEQASAYGDAKKAWRDGGKKGPEPKQSDFIGMTRAEFRRGQKGGGSTSSKQDSGLKPMPIEQANQAYNDAWDKVRAGEPGWKGLDDASIRKKLRDLYGAAGYQFP